MKILDEVKSLSARDVAWIVVLIVVLSPGIKAGLALLSGLIEFAGAQIK